MMAYQNGFVACIVRNGHVQKEDQRRVVLPEGSEYGVRFRNKNARRASATLYIDGEYQGTWVVPPHDYVDIFRPVSKDVAFKFVGHDSEEATDHGKNELTSKSGLVEVDFQLEVERKEPTVYKPIPYVSRPNPWVRPRETYPGVRKSLLGERRMKSSGGPCGQSVGASCNFDGEYKTSGAIGAASFSANETNSVVGVTVEGGRTGQSFGTTSFDVEYHKTRVTIKLVLAREVERVYPNYVM